MQAIVNETLNDKETSTVHKFQLAGLGQAPFSFTGKMTEKTYCAYSGAPIQPGSNCDYCGTSIRYEFWVRSSDGNEFKVGCDCIHKTGDAGLIRQISVAERKLRDAKNAAAKERKQQKKTLRIAEAQRLLPTVRGRLASKSHPNTYYASQGKTMLDYVDWCMANGAGEKAASIIENAAE